jgi:hypothetical protein
MSYCIRIVLALALATMTAAAQAPAGVNLADSVNVNGQTLVLNGTGVRTKFVVKVYVGALYLPAKQSWPDAVLAPDAPRRMVMHFLRDVEGAKMVEAWQSGLADNTPNASPEVRAAFDLLASWMEDIPKGNELVITYLPDKGTIVTINGRMKGILPGGKPVADAILATWIGPSPGPGEEFKRAVLGQ